MDVEREEHRTRRPTFAPSKVAIPEPAASWVERPDLVGRLDEGPAEGLTLVVGSPGSGKTSLLAQWARARPPGTVAWLSCDAADLDPVRFWHGLIGAVAGVRPGFADECLDLLALHEIIDADLLECLLRAGDDVEPVALVVDDLQLAGPEVHEHLRFLAGRGPGGVRLLVGARAEPALGLDRLRLEGRLGEVREADLRFSAHEARRLLAALGVEVDPQDLDVVMARTEGWVAGVQLAAVALRHAARPDDLVARLHGSHQLIGHYLWTEVFESQPDDVQRFLLDTCVADELSPGLAAALSPGTPVTLLDVEAANLLLVRLDPHGRSFRYHHLFLEMLRFRLRSTAPDHELVLHGRAAGWHVEHGEPAAAFRHRWRAGQRTAAIEAMHGQVLQAYLDDLLPAFDERDRSLTDDDLLAAPGPAVSYCTALLTRGFVEDSERLASRIEVVAGTRLDPPAQEQLLAVRALDALVLGDTRATIRYGSALLGRTHRAVADDDWLALGVTGMARAHAWEGDADAAADLIGSLRIDPASPTSQIELLSTASFCHLLAGDLTEAVAGAEEALRVLATAGPDTDAVLHPTAVLGVARLERADLVGAERALRDVADSGSMLRVPVRVLATVGLSRIERAAGRFDAALALLDDALHLVRRRPPRSGLLDHVRARQGAVLIDAGDLEAAASVVDAVAGSVARGVLDARLAMATGRPDEARGALDAVRTSASSRRQRIDVGLGDLAVALACDEPADDLAVEVLDLAAPEGVVLPLAEAGSALLDAVRSAARPRPRSPYVDRLMSTRPCLPPSSAGGSATRFDALSERERTVLGYLATSMTYREIADALSVSVNTVKTHAKNISRKLQTGSRAEALARARELHHL